MRRSGAFAVGSGVRRSAWLQVILAVIGLALLAIGYLVVTTWAVSEGGVVCGAPLDNPGWETGVPCHGAVNRRTAVGWSLVANGLGFVVAAGVLLIMGMTASRSEAHG